jgi:hypothetical protein
MKCSSNFILAYNRLFKYLKDYDNLEEFWPLLSEAVLGQLRFLVKTKGVVGMVEYWAETLAAEGAECSLIVNLNKHSTFEIVMRECPSLAKIKEAGETPCYGYCSHCEMLYAPLLEKLGYKYETFSMERGCVIRITENK